MGYSSVQEAIVGVCRGSGVAGIDWTSNRSPYYVEAAEPFPDQPFPFLVFELPESSVSHTQEDPYVEVYRPRFYVIGLEADVAVLLSAYDPAGMVAFLDSLRGTQALPSGYKSFDGDHFECMQFTRDSFQLAKGSSRAPAGERTWEARATYYMEIQPK